MQALSRKRCFNHSDREAVALCLNCQRFFCRECVTEHHDRVLCAACLSAPAMEKTRKNRLSVFFKACLFLSLFILLWLFFYSTGQLLLKLPHAFHEGTLWKDLWQQI